MVNYSRCQKALWYRRHNLPRTNITSCPNIKSDISGLINQQDHIGIDCFLVNRKHWCIDISTHMSLFIELYVPNHNQPQSLQQCASRHSKTRVYLWNNDQYQNNLNKFVSEKYDGNELALLPSLFDVFQYQSPN